MGTVIGTSYRPQLQLSLRFPSFGIICSSEVSVSRQQVLKQVDKELDKGDERAALSLVKDLQGKPGGLRCFGAARQVLPNSGSFFFFFFLCSFSFRTPFRLFPNNFLAAI